MKVGSNQILELLHQVALVSVITEFLFQLQNNIIVFILKLRVVLYGGTFFFYFNNLRCAVILNQWRVIRLVYPHFNHAPRQFTQLHGFFHEAYSSFLKHYSPDFVIVDWFYLEFFSSHYFYCDLLINKFHEFRSINISIMYW